MERYTGRWFSLSAVSELLSACGDSYIGHETTCTDEVLADVTAYMQFTLVDGEIRQIPVSEGVKMVLDGETYYVYTGSVNAKEMTDIILSQFFYKGGVSVQSSCKRLL